MNLIGDVKGKVAVMVDDMIDTAGELCIISLSFGKNVIQMIICCVLESGYIGHAILYFLLYLVLTCEW